MSSILWSRLDRPGHEAARVIETPRSRELRGAALFVDAERPVLLDYHIVCNLSWRTESAAVHGWVGTDAIDIAIAVSADGEWSMNGKLVPAVGGCIDVDLNFSPSTNLLPIRRLNLAAGESSLVRAAWLRFPSFELELLEQVYRRLGPRTYEYESGGGTFSSQLEVNDAGFPTLYAGVWRAEASA